MDRSREMKRKICALIDDMEHNDGEMEEEFEEKMMGYVDLVLRFYNRDIISFAEYLQRRKFPDSVRVP